MNHKQECLDIYYASDVVNKELTFGCELLRKSYDTKYKVLTDFGFGIRTNSVWVASAVRGSFAVNWYDTEEVKKSIITDSQGEQWQIMGHPPTGFDWLRLIALDKDGEVDNHNSKKLGAAHIAGKSLYIQPNSEEDFIKFDLITNEPYDWETLYNIIKPGDNSKD